jgi:hypothetical protein
MVAVNQTGKSLVARSIVARLTIVALGMCAVGTVAIPAGVALGWLDITSGIGALTLCLVSTLLGHLAGEYPQGDDFFMVRMAGSMFVRTAIPLIVCVVAKLNQVIPEGSGFVFFVLLFYLVGLIIDVSLHGSRLSSTRLKSVD